jgi:hypothetical protein
MSFSKAIYRLLSAVGLSVGALVIFFALAEIVSRLVLEKPQSMEIQGLSQMALPDPGGEKQELVSRGLAGYAIYEWSGSKTGIRLKKNMRVVIKKHDLNKQDIELSTNALGFRYGDIRKKKSSDFRILVLGDSIIFADYAPATETIPAHMESHLRSRDQTRQNIQVINAGGNGGELEGEFAVLVETGLSVEPDVVLVGLYLNDANSSYFVNAGQYPPWIRWSHFLTYVLNRVQYLTVIMENRERIVKQDAALDEFTLKNPVSDGASWKDSQEGFNNEIVNAFGDWGYAWTDEAWMKMEGTAQLLEHVAYEHDIELIFVLFPVRQQVQSDIYRDEPQRKFHTIMQRLGIKHLDLLPALRSKYQEDGIDVFYDHCHYRAEGNAFIADTISRFLISESDKLKWLAAASAK